MANVFGALNRFIARLDSDPNAAGRNSNNSGSASNAYGFQILRNTNTDLALEPWFDFIIGINGHNIDNPDPNLLMTELSNCAGSTISLGVYSAKGQEIREAYIAVPQPGQSLGLSLQWSPLNLADDVWHVLDVIPNSPADVAGLLPYSDYVIGTPERGAMPRGDGGLGELVEAFLNRPLRLYVYNQEYDVTRMVTITPARDWGGDGALGCVLGYGALHRIPAPLTEPTQAPGETLFESGDGTDGIQLQQQQQQQYAPTPVLDQQQQQQGADYLVPADMDFTKSGPTSPSAGGPPPPQQQTPAGRAKKVRAHHNTAATAGLDDYFAEGEQKSRELDNAPTAKNGGGLPPPPKMTGGPPKASTPAPEAES